MLAKTQAIVLHSIKYGETRLIVDMFTRLFGRQTFIVTIPKSSKGKMKKQFFQPLTMLEIETDIRPNAQLQKLNEVRILNPFISIPFEPDKLAILLFIGEFLYYALRSEQRNELLFDYMENSILWLDSQTAHFANFHLVFMLRMTRFLGFYPNLSDYRDGDYFDLRESVFMRNPPVHRDFLYPEEAQKVQLMMRMDFSNMRLFRMTHQDRNRLLEVSLKYYRLHLPDFPEMKSIEILQTLYQ